MKLIHSLPFPLSLLTFASLREVFFRLFSSLRFFAAAIFLRLTDGVIDTGSQSQGLRLVSWNFKSDQTHSRARNPTHG
jgi:hypothetical protein